MSDTINIPMSEKEKYIEELDKFIEETGILLEKACSQMGVDLNRIINKHKEPHITCPFNDRHRVPERTIEKHLISCEWRSLGYTKECKPLPEPSLPPGHPSSIKFDMQLQHKVLQLAKEKNPELNIGIDEKLIPQTSDRLTSDFSRDEKKALYEYVLANTMAPDMGQDIADMNKAEEKELKSTPIIELLAQERNLKRRRAKHRGVHTNKKSQTEILREIIEQQMEMYKDHISTKFGISINDEAEEDHSKINKGEVKESQKQAGECSYSQTKQEHLQYFNKDIPSHHYDNSYMKTYYKYQTSKSFSDKDYNTKHKSYNKYYSTNLSDKEEEDQSYSRHYTKNYLDNCDKYDYHDRKRDKDYGRHKSSNGSTDKVNSTDQNYDFTDSNSHKRHKSKEKKSKHHSNERKSHKKHKKHKRKRESSCDSQTNSKHHKSSKYKRD